MALSKPITTSAIGAAIGSSSRVIGALCKHSGINCWAYGKPIRHPATYEIGSSERADRDQGFDLGMPAGIVADKLHNIGESLYAAMSVIPKWEDHYLKPRGLANNEYYRFLDFNGYNHNAVAPFVKPSDLTDVTLNTELYITQQFAEIDWSKFKTLTSETGWKTKWRYAVVAKKSSQLSIGLGNTIAAEESSTHIGVPIQLQEGYGTYQVMWIITKATAAGAVTSSEYIVVPNGYMTLTVTERRYTVSYSLEWATSTLPTLKHDTATDTYYIHWQPLQATFTNPDGRTGNYHLVATLFGTQSGEERVIAEFNPQGATGFVNGSTSQTAHFFDNAPYEEIGRPLSSYSNIWVRLEVMGEGNLDCVTTIYFDTYLDIIEE